MELKCYPPRVCPLCAAVEHKRISRFYPRVQGACDIAVIGSGFAGSLIAMIARAQGRSVVLLEKGKHPRFAIGESSTPLANLILEELCERYGLDAVRPLTKWGTWQKTQ